MKKLEIEYLRLEFEKRGCKLLESVYKGNHTPMLFECRCGQISSIMWSNFRRRGQCRYCGRESTAEKQRHSLKFIQDAFAERGCRLISRDYENNREKLNFICVCGHSAKISFSKFQQGELCNNCAPERRSQKLKHDEELVRAELKRRGFILLEPYVNARTPLKIKCEAGDHVTKSMTYDNIIHDEHCPRCAGKGKLDLEYAQKFFEERGCKLTATDYKNNQTPMPYICGCGRESMITLGNLQKGERCRVCGIESNSGQNHYNWNFNLSPEERQIMRAYPEYYHWRKSIFERDNFTCQCCGISGVDLEAHHKYSYHCNEALRLELSNGLTLCLVCHYVFHSIYGKKNNTEEQLDQFIAEFYKYAKQVEDRRRKLKRHDGLLK